MDIFTAVRRGDVSGVERALRSGVSVDVGDERGDTPLHYACRNNQTEVVKCLLSHKAGVDVRDKNGVTALHKACVNNHTDVVKCLLSHKAGVDVRDGRGFTPLMCAARFDSLESMRLLLSHGASLNTQDDGGVTALSYAAFFGHPRTTRVLLEAGADTQMCSENKRTPLHMAAMHGDPETVELLLQYGSDTQARDDEGKTALDWAREMNNAAVVKMLEKHAVTPVTRHDTPQTIVNMTSLQYSPEEKQLLLAFAIFLVVPLGETLAGKTTLIRTIMAMVSCLTGLSERTKVAEVSSWIPPSAKDSLFLMFDVGGHDSYRDTAHIFQINAAHMITLVCHDITSKNFKATMFWLKTCQVNAPKSTVRIILTKIDLLKTEQERDVSSSEFVKEITTLIDQEIKSIRRRLHHCTEEFKQTYETHISNYNNIKAQIKPGPKCQLLKVSCKPGWEESLQLVRDLLLKFTEDKEHQIMLRPIDKELFVQIGKLGIKKHMVRTELSQRQIKNTELRSRQGVHMKTTKSETASKLDQSDESVSRTVVSPVKEANKQEKHRENFQQQFMRFFEIMDVFESIYKAHHPQESSIPRRDLRQKGIESLTNLKSAGLIRFFSQNIKDTDIIYNDLNTLVSILVCIFDHDLLKHLVYDDDCMKFYHTSRQFKSDCDALTKFGTLSMTLLSYLLQKSQCAVPEKDVAKLLTSLGVGFQFRDETCPNQVRLFVPFFLSEDLPKHLTWKKSRTSTCHKRILALQTVIKAEAPRVFLHFLIVKIYEKLSRHLRIHNNIHTWSSGISASLDDFQGELIMTQNEDQSIEFCISADVTEGEGHDYLWEYITFMDQVTVDTRDSKFPGLPLEYLLLCLHCVLEGMSVKAEYPVCDMLTPNFQPRKTFSCADINHLPRALIAPLPQVDSMNDSIRTHKTELRESIPLDIILNPLFETKVLSLTQYEEIQAVEDRKGMSHASGVLLDMVIRGDVETRCFLHVVGEQVPWVVQQIEEWMNSVEGGKRAEPDSRGKSWRQHCLHDLHDYLRENCETETRPKKGK